jgi:hypothetical protein
MLSPQYMVYQRMIPSTLTLTIAITTATLCGLGIVLLTKRLGLKWIRPLTLVPVMILLFFLLHTNGWLLDANYSARPLAKQIATVAPDVKLLVTHHIRRDTDYGLAFYRNQPLRHYLQEESATEKQSVIAGIPNEKHILVIKSDDTVALTRLLPMRHYKLLFLDDWQGLAIYRVDAIQ